MTTSMFLFLAFTSMLVFGLGITAYAWFTWGRPQPRRRHRHRHRHA